MKDVEVSEEVRSLVKSLISGAVELYDRPSCTTANAVLAIDVETLRYAFSIPGPCMCGNPEEPNMAHWTGTDCYPFSDDD